MKNRIQLALGAIALATASLASAQTALLNVSYDVSREFYKDLNTAFVAHVKKTSGKDIKVDQSHAGSSAQARAVADGLEADVVTFNTTTDVDFLAERGVVAKDWRQKFPNGAAPTTSTMLFLVRQGNPKGIKDWDDLIKPGVQVIVVNPKTGGNGRMAYLAAWGQVRAKGGSDADALEFVSKLYKNVPVLARGGRDATGIFLQRNIGDVLVTFESEVVSVDNEFGKGRVDAIHPSASIVAENPVAIVERTVAKRRARPPTPRPTWTSCTARKARKSPPGTTSARATRRCSRSTPRRSSRSSCSPSTSTSVRWVKRRRCTSTTAASSTSCIRTSNTLLRRAENTPLRR